MEHTAIAVDLAKSVFHVAVSHRAGRIDTEKRLSRDRFLPYLAQQPPATVPTALIALVGNVHRFESGRHFASVLGPMPKEDSSALRRRLGAISTQRDVYLRMLLIPGARSFLWHAQRAAHPHALEAWARTTEQRRGHNVAAVAVANKLARIMWAVWRPQRPFAVDDLPSDVMA